MSSICNQTCFSEVPGTLSDICLSAVCVEVVPLQKTRLGLVGLKPPYFSFFLSPVSSVLLLGCLKYPGKDILMQPWFRSCSRFICSGSVFGLRVHRPTAHPPWAQPIVSFLPSSSPCCSLSAVSDPSQGPQLLAQLSSKIS